MFMTYHGEQSSRKKLPGGGPQGAFLGELVFIINYKAEVVKYIIHRARGCSGGRGTDIKNKNECKIGL